MCLFTLFDTDSHQYITEVARRATLLDLTTMATVRTFGRDVISMSRSHHSRYYYAATIDHHGCVRLYGWDTGALLTMIILYVYQARATSSSTTALTSRTRRCTRCARTATASSS